MKCVCVEENISHICRVYADERRCMCIHTTTGSVYKGRFINHLGKRVSLKNHGQWTQQQHREMTTTSMAFLETPDCILMLVQTLHRNECITVHLIFFFSIYFFGVDLLPVVQERKVSTEDKTVSDMWQTGACAVQERWSNMTKVTKGLLKNMLFIPVTTFSFAGCFNCEPRETSRVTMCYLKAIAQCYQRNLYPLYL